MKIRSVAMLFALAVPGMVGCGEDPATPAKTPFELDGKWTYLGPSDGTHDLMIGGGKMVYTDDLGTWSSTWNIKSYDNDSDRFQVTLGSGMGSYLPTGQSMSGTYLRDGAVLTIQLASGLTAYPPLQRAGTCTAEADGTPIPDCRLYIKGN